MSNLCAYYVLSGPLTLKMQNKICMIWKEKSKYDFLGISLPLQPILRFNRLIERHAIAYQQVRSLMAGGGAGEYVLTPSYPSTPTTHTRLISTISHTGVLTLPAQWLRQPGQPAVNPTVLATCRLPEHIYDMYVHENHRPALLKMMIIQGCWPCQPNDLHSSGNLP